MNDLWQKLESAWNEQLAGTTPPVVIPAPEPNKDAEPLRVWPSNGGKDL